MSTNPRYAEHSKRLAVTKQLAMECRPCWICHYAIPYALKNPHHPLHFEVDEYEPISRGGSPTEYHNLGAAHRCCNNWRSNRSVAEVNATKAAIVQVYGGWSSPEDFVAKAKALKGKKLPREYGKPTTTTEW